MSSEIAMAPFSPGVNHIAYTSPGYTSLHLQYPCMRVMLRSDLTSTLQSRSNVAETSQDLDAGRHHRMLSRLSRHVIKSDPALL